MIVTTVESFDYLTILAKNKRGAIMTCQDDLIVLVRNNGKSQKGDRQK